jgi:hypothetical protein
LIVLIKIKLIEEWTLINIKDVIDAIMHELDLDLPRFAKPTRLL